MEKARRIISMLLVTSILGLTVFSCATKPEKIKPQYISPAMYSDYDCDQLRGEIMRVTSRLSELSGEQRGERGKDAAAVGVGLVLFWPALFFLMGDDVKDEISRLKGEYEALQQQAILKKCEYSADLAVVEEKVEPEKKEKPDQDNRPSNGRR